MGKRGPKKRHGKREPNGRLSRTVTARADAMNQEQRDTMSVAIEARQRVWGLSRDASRDQMAGSAIGRYCLAEKIKLEQYDAAMAYLAEREEYHRYIVPPRPPGAVDPNATHGRALTEENEARVRHVMASWATTNAAIRDAQLAIRNDGNLRGAIDAVLIRDVQLDHLLGDIRIALNALARRYGLVARMAA